MEARFVWMEFPTSVEITMILMRRRNSGAAWLASVCAMMFLIESLSTQALLHIRWANVRWQWDIWITAVPRISC